jgi:hypothetical protein
MTDAQPPPFPEQELFVRKPRKPKQKRKTRASTKLNEKSKNRVVGWLWFYRLVGPLIGLKTRYRKPEVVRREFWEKVWTSPLMVTIAALIALLIVLILIDLNFFAGGIGWSHIAAVDPNLWYKSSAIKSQSEAMTAPAFLDANGEFVGTPPPSLLGQNRPDRALAVAITSRDIPSSYSRIIQSLEQGTLNSYRTNVFGADWTTAGLAAASLGRRGGASSMPQQIARVVLHLGRAGETPTQTLGRKWTEATYGGSLALTLQKQYGAKWIGELIRQYATVQPIAAVPEISGLFAGAQIIFGKTPGKLTDAQSAVLAAAAQRPMVFHHLPDGSYGLTAVAEFRIRARAANGIRKAFADDERRRDQALAELNIMPRISPKQIQGISANDFDAGSLIQPARRAMALAGSDMIIALGELKKASIPLESLSRVGLSSAIGPNVEFKRNFLAELKNLDAKGTLGVSLAPKPTGGKSPADVVAIGIDRLGNIDRVFSTTQYYPLDRPIPLASAGKIIAALALPGRCTLNPHSYAWIFGKSKPEALEPLLRHCATKTQLVALATVFDFHVDAPDIFHAIAYGMVTATPRAAILAYSALEDRLRGGRGAVPAPHIVAKYEDRAGYSAVPPRRIARLTRGIVGTKNVEFARIVLRAPALPGGTVAGLARRCPGLAVAKTGTVGGSGNDGDRSRLLAGAFNDGRAFFIFVTARDGGLIGRLSGADLIQLAEPFCRKGVSNA